MSCKLAFLLATCALIPLAGVEVANSPPTPAAAVTTALGSITLDDIPITVNRIGDLTPGQALNLDLVLPHDVSAPTALTVWVSTLNDPTAAAETPDKIRASAGLAGHWTAKVKLPASLDKAMLWVSVTRGDRRPVSGSLALQ